ncbi:hypothetical protein AG1IA_00599 [Rhizoctonia solani AG-1 IA]|uniref:Gfd2/YDR514C-like C-terminal domain-containing protein n=1 Tax=Thanatephorus cucumeris (strain AG1-IA) TaxID=983506 RepID=L8X591_THACA|nr:hypothetical protein AG1IA_00599 [Rhizoctonia solani AG-1 IA]
MKCSFRLGVNRLCPLGGIVKLDIVSSASTRQDKLQSRDILLEGCHSTSPEFRPCTRTPKRKCQICAIRRSRMVPAAQANGRHSTSTSCVRSRSSCQIQDFQVVCGGDPSCHITPTRAILDQTPGWSRTGPLRLVYCVTIASLTLLKNTVGNDRLMAVAAAMYGGKSQVASCSTESTIQPPKPNNYQAPAPHALLTILFSWSSPPLIPITPCSFRARVLLQVTSCFLGWLWIGCWGGYGQTGTYSRSSSISSRGSSCGYACPPPPRFLRLNITMAFIESEEWVNEGWYSDRSALKAFLHTDSLISDECPLHPGAKGMEVFMAIIQNGESRLCFSLKQISYARYWLHAYGLTSEPLPLPSSHYLLTLNDLRGPPSPVTYKTVSELRNALKDVGKHNKRVKTFAGDFALGELRTVFERVRSVWGERRGTWMAIDFEGWEMDHTIITEFGWSLIRWDPEEVAADPKEGDNPGEVKLKEVREEGHWTVKEYAVMPKTVFKKRIGDLITKYAAEGPLYLVFHDRYGDVNRPVPGCTAWIRQVHRSYLSRTCCSIGCAQQKDMFSALEGDSHQQRGLERVCLLLKINGFNHPHNAGNDAHVGSVAVFHRVYEVHNGSPASNGDRQTARSPARGTMAKSDTSIVWSTAWGQR